MPQEFPGEFEGGVALERVKSIWSIPDGLLPHHPTFPLSTFRPDILSSGGLIPVFKGLIQRQILLSK